MFSTPRIFRLSAAALLLGLLPQLSAQAGGKAVPAASQATLAMPPVPGLIIKFKTPAMAQRATGAMVAQQGAEHVQQIAGVAARQGMTVSFERRLATGADLFKLSKPMSVAAAFRLARQMQRQNPDIVYAEPDVINKPMGMVHPAFVPNDPGYYLQWDMHEQTGGMNVQNAWDITRGKGAVVAVLDTGVRPHPDLVANLLPGYDFVGTTEAGNDGDARDADPTDPGDDCGQGSSWHGTHVSGTIAAVAGNGQGVSGVAPEAKVVPVRVLGKCGGRSSDIVDGMIWAAGGTVDGVPANANPAKVLNMSLGSSIPCLNSYREAISKVSGMGAFIVVAAGNAGQNVRDSQPASCPGVFAVAANNREGGRSYYSNYGAQVAVTAPGGETINEEDGILSTLNDGKTDPGNDNYGFYQGTSMAAPHIAGLAALMLSVNPAMSATKLRELIMRTARPFPAACAGCGTGIADADAAVKAALAAK